MHPISVRFAGRDSGMRACARAVELTSNHLCCWLPRPGNSAKQHDGRYMLANLSGRTNLQ